MSANVLISALPEMLLPIVLKFAKELADSAIDGADLNQDQRDGVVVAHKILSTYGKRYAEKSETEYDDQIVDWAISVLTDLAEEGDIQL